MKNSVRYFFLRGGRTQGRTAQRALASGTDAAPTGCSAERYLAQTLVGRPEASPRPRSPAGGRVFPWEPTPARGPGRASANSAGAVQKHNDLQVRTARDWLRTGRAGRTNVPLLQTARTRIQGPNSRPVAGCDGARPLLPWRPQS